MGATHTTAQGSRPQKHTNSQYNTTPSLLVKPTIPRIHTPTPHPSLALNVGGGAGTANPLTFNATPLNVSPATAVTNQLYNLAHLRSTALAKPGWSRRIRLDTLSGDRSKGHSTVQFTMDCPLPVPFPVARTSGTLCNHTQPLPFQVGHWKWRTIITF
jgi:hypothetical protein